MSFLNTSTYAWLDEFLHFVSKGQIYLFIYYLTNNDKLIQDLGIQFIVKNKSTFMTKPRSETRVCMKLHEIEVRGPCAVPVNKFMAQGKKYIYILLVINSAIHEWV